MTLQSSYVYSCDADKCSVVSPAMDNNWTLPAGWSRFDVKEGGKLAGRTMFFCPKDTGAILDGFVKLSEEEENA